MMANKYGNVATNKGMHRDVMCTLSLSLFLFPLPSLPSLSPLSLLGELNEIITSPREAGALPTHVATPRICRRAQYDNTGETQLRELSRIDNGESTLRQIKIIAAARQLARNPFRARARALANCDARTRQIQ